MAEVLRWPEQRDHGKRLADAGVAVLYVVATDDDPPMPTTCLEDWVRIPGDDRDLRARVAALELRAAAHHAPPRVDNMGRLHYHGKLLALAPDEARLAGTLTEHFGAVVPDSELEVADHDSSSPSLRAQMAQLRARLRPVDLILRRIPNRGYQLQRR